MNQMQVLYSKLSLKGYMRVRELSEWTGIKPTSVRRALKDLKDRDLIDKTYKNTWFVKTSAVVIVKEIKTKRWVKKEIVSPEQVVKEIGFNGIEKE